MNGFLLIDKPAGFTSNDVLNILKKKTGIKKMGHSGTLDPFATGLLVVGLGEGVKFIPYLKEEPKVYQAILKLETSTDTLDLTGLVVGEKKYHPLSLREIEKRCQSLLGKREQLPPLFSAKKRKGKRFYDLARQGVAIERTPHEITIFDLSITKIECLFLSFRVSCSRGTYVRVLGEEIACLLDTVGHLTELTRLSNGPFNVSGSASPDEVVLERDLISIESALTGIPHLSLSKKEAASVIKGQTIFSGEKLEGLVGLHHDGLFLGVGRSENGILRPLRLMSEGEVSSIMSKQR